MQCSELFVICQSCFFGSKMVVYICMSGHSKWATIKRAKAATDAKRGNIFTKLGNNITVAAKEGGGDPVANFKLRLAMEQAKKVNMPKDNIERAIKRGTGELKGDIIEEVMYGGFLPGQYPIIIKCLTDNKNRALTEVKTALQKNGGQFVELNAIAWQFENKGVIKIQNSKFKTQNDLEEIIIEAGADDYEISEDEIVIYTKPEDLQVVKEKLEGNGLKVDSADLEMVAKKKKDLDNINAEKIEKVLGLLDELDDVNNYYMNIK